MFIAQTSNHMAKLAMDKSILREYANNSNDRIVYLNNDDEFQIQLFNPETFTIGAEISINGEPLQGLLIVKPGERVWLERPMVGNNKKFKFETYTVEDSATVDNAIRNNGEIKIKFYKEYVRPTIVYQPYTSIIPDYSNPYYTTCLNSCKGAELENAYSNSVQISCDINMNANAITSTNFERSTITGSDGRSFSKVRSAHIEPEKITEPEKAVKETGRIGSGSVSEQRFNTVNTEFDTFPYKTETIKILPMSQKPFTNSDLQKKYCVNCGRKLNPKYKFCPYCGTKCDQFFE
ncbi:MAG: hypothetical protein [Wendovervirus sonii]|uniref:Zinc-ribbon domain-containing protein n=1 Tax=phage Lak_Megaphage_Sonny TaxID=3109229 RepID=A0ABZ0Z432_9CAUD|nr:MAG: hypothetical protein [phage Lak_Megaphage_Sonny]